MNICAEAKMTTLAPEARTHAPLVSAPIGASLGGLGSGTSVPLNRGLERALEEAANSGRLNLSCRKLKEFPKNATNYDLTDTVEAGRLRQSSLCLDRVPATPRAPKEKVGNKRTVCVGFSSLWRSAF